MTNLNKVSIFKRVLLVALILLSATTCSFFATNLKTSHAANVSISQPSEVAMESTNSADLVISTPQDLIDFRTKLATSAILGGTNYYGKTVMLAANIDMSGLEWQSVSKSFAGTFDGNGFTISNLRLTPSDSSSVKSVGFLNIKNATIKNLRIDNATISLAQENCAKVTDIGIFGGVAAGDADNDCTNVLENCAVTNSSIFYSVTSKDQVSNASNISIGGFYGTFNGGKKGERSKIIHCFSNIDITVIYGKAATSTQGAIKATNKIVSIGGLVGDISYGQKVEITQSYYYGDMDLACIGCREYTVGGFVGRLTSTRKTYTEHTTDVDVETPSLHISNSYSYFGFFNDKSSASTFEAHGGPYQNKALGEFVGGISTAPNWAQGDQYCTLAGWSTLVGTTAFWLESIFDILSLKNDYTCAPSNLRYSACDMSPQKILDPDDKTQTGPMYRNILVYSEFLNWDVFKVSYIANASLTSAKLTAQDINQDLAGGDSGSGISTTNTGTKSDWYLPSNGDFNNGLPIQGVFVSEVTFQSSDASLGKIYFEETGTREESITIYVPKGTKIDKSSSSLFDGTIVAKSMDGAQFNGWSTDIIDKDKVIITANFSKEEIALRVEVTEDKGNGFFRGVSNGVSFTLDTMDWQYNQGYAEIENINCPVEFNVDLNEKSLNIGSTQLIYFIPQGFYKLKKIFIYREYSNKLAQTPYIVFPFDEYYTEDTICYGVKIKDDNVGLGFIPDYDHTKANSEFWAGKGSTNSSKTPQFRIVPIFEEDNTLTIEASVEGNKATISPSSYTINDYKSLNKQFKIVCEDGVNFNIYDVAGAKGTLIYPAKITGYENGYTYSTFKYAFGDGNYKYLEMDTENTQDGCIKISDDRFKGVKRILQIKIYTTPIAYTLPMYYSDKDNKYLTANKIDATFTIAGSSNLYATTPKDIDETNTFGAWVIGVKNNYVCYLYGGAYTNNGMSDTRWKITPTDTPNSGNDKGGTLNVDIDKVGTNQTLDYGLLKFNYSDKYVVAGTTYYVISKDVSLINGGYLVSGYTEAPPIVVARWSRNYNVTIDNSVANSRAKDFPGTRTDYEGVFGGGNVLTSADNLSVSFNVKVGTNYYPFMTSFKGNGQFENGTGTALAFYKKSELTSAYWAKNGANYYAIYNYGYEISGYQIQIQFNNRVNGRTKYYLTCSNGVWGTTTDNTYFISLGELVNENSNSMSLYAEYLDKYYASLSSGTKISSIKIIPKWTPATIWVTRRDSSHQSHILCKTSYNDIYDLNDIKGSAGKTFSFYCVEYNSVKYTIVTQFEDAKDNEKLKWNYYTIPQNLYEYTSAFKAYFLELQPQYTDNIYKISLTNAKLNASDNYELFTDEYKFENSTNLSNLYTFKDFTVSNKDYSSCYQDNTWADTVAREMVAFVSNYETSLTNRTHEKLNKVYYSSGTASGKILTPGTNCNLYFYLANDHEVVGNLPEFVSASYVQIAWNNKFLSQGGHGAQYVYITSQYIDDYANSIENFEKTEVWKLDHGGSAGNLAFEAIYYRKQYAVNVNTVFANNLEARGYAVVKTIDNEPSGQRIVDGDGTYLVVYNNGSMRYYQLGNVGTDNLNTIRIVTNDGVTWQGSLVDKIVLYSNCNLKIQVFDQSRDTLLASSGKFDDMVGYRYSGYQSTDLMSAIHAKEDNRYLLEAEHSGIEALNRANGYTFTINLNFEKIIYSVNIQLTDKNAGNLVVQDAQGRTSAQVKEVTLTFTVDSGFTITYQSNAGYKLVTNAFVLYKNGKTIILQNYDDSNPNQIYAAFTNAEWLRSYYNACDETYSAISPQGIGRLSIQTELIEFDYKVKVYDSSTNSYINEGVYVGKWKLFDNRNNPQLISLESIFSEVGVDRNGKVYGYIEAGKNYAVLVSYVYKYKNANERAYEDHYAFPLYSKPNKTYYIDTALLSEMVDSGSGIIVPKDKRTIYMLVDVREIFTLTVKVEKAEHDTNSTNRSVVITNSIENRLDLAPAATLPASMSMFTYKGQNNNISYVYNEKYYSSVEATVDGKEISNPLQIECDSTLTIKFIPKALKVRVEYYLNGAKVEREQVVNTNINTILTKLDVTANAELYLDDMVTISYLVNNRDYDVTTFINDEYFATPNNSASYKVAINQNPNPFEYGEIYIRFNVDLRDNGQISIQFALKDQEQATNDEFEYAFVAGDEEFENQESYRVIEGRSVKIKFTLKTGYLYYGYSHNNGIVQFVSPVAGDDGWYTLTLTDSFVPTRHGGNYTIFFTKEMFDVVLTIGSSSQKIYTINTETQNGIKNSDASQVRLSGIFVGQTIYFNREEVPNEEVRNYYYITNNYQNISFGEATSFVVSSDILQRSTTNDAGKTRTLMLGVSTLPKYRLNVTIAEGINYMTYNSTDFYNEDGSYVYFTRGEVVDLTITPAQQEKYDITLTGDVSATFDVTKTTQIVMDRDKDVRIVAVPKAFAVETNKQIFNTLEELASDNPQQSTLEQGDVSNLGSRFGDSAVVTIKKAKSTEELFDLTFKDEIAEFTIKFKDDKFENTLIVEVANGTFENNIITFVVDEVAYSYTLTETDEEIQISYTITSAAKLDVTFISLKVISAGQE